VEKIQLREASALATVEIILPITSDLLVVAHYSWILGNEPRPYLYIIT